MSATLDGERVARLLGEAPVLRSLGRTFPIETHYVPPSSATRLEQSVAGCVRRALREGDGGILVFLPGEGEIRAVERLLSEESLGPSVEVMPLYGALAQAVQDRAIRPLPGIRKIVLATSIAETSLTIEDIRVVIDSGLQRLPRFDPASGLTRLVTQRLSAASAEQRRGRAGRVAPGTCYRLWSEPETRSLIPFTPPEILSADLAPLALDLALWGIEDPSKLAWLDPPPSSAFNEARSLLRELDALDGENRVTSHGRAIATFGAHPRLAHMMIRGKELGLGASAAALAAVLTERDIIKAGRDARDADLRLRLEAFAGEAELASGAALDRGAISRAREQARLWHRELDLSKSDQFAPSSAGRLAALAYPDRVAQRRGAGSFRLANGRGATLPEIDPLSAENFLAIASLDAGGANARIFQAAPLSLSEIEDLFADHIEVREDIAWDSRERIVVARRREMLRSLILSDAPVKNAPREKIAAAMLTGIRELTLTALPWTSELQTLRNRTAFLRRLDPNADLPDLSDEHLSQTLEAWLLPFLAGISRASDLPRLNLSEAIHALFSWEQKKRLDALAPTHMTVPSGSHIPIDYSGETPVLAVRLQEMFGLADTPTVANGRVPVTLHLLSPAHRPVQVTRDLRSFWNSGYADVKRDLKGRYPKHHWPDDPWAARPTARAKRRGE
jgi:ATP-dependent helicase HrpB